MQRLNLPDNESRGALLRHRWDAGCRRAPLYDQRAAAQSDRPVAKGLAAHDAVLIHCTPKKALDALKSG